MSPTDSSVQRAMQQRRLTRSVQNLLGICAGMVADGELHDNEIVFLSTWLRENEEVTQAWPGNVISERVTAILTAGKIEDAARNELLAFLTRFSGNSFNETGAAQPEAPSVPFDEGASIEFPGRSFCLTGKFTLGSRSECEKMIKKMGGFAVSTVSSSLHYLVVGGGCSPDWINSTYGRKIEAAMARKSCYGQPSIVTEAALLKALECTASPSEAPELSEVDLLRAILQEKITNGEAVRIEMGTAYDWEMNEIPWRATVIPLAFTQSTKGPRLRCRVDTGNDYMITTADQQPGLKNLLLGKFRLIDFT